MMLMQEPLPSDSMLSEYHRKRLFDFMLPVILLYPYTVTHVLAALIGLQEKEMLLSGAGKEKC